MTAPAYVSHNAVLFLMKRAKKTIHRVNMSWVECRDSDIVVSIYD